MQIFPLVVPQHTYWGQQGEFPVADKSMRSVVGSEGGGSLCLWVPHFYHPCKFARGNPSINSWGIRFSNSSFHTLFLKSPFKFGLSVYWNCWAISFTSPFFHNRFFEGFGGGFPFSPFLPSALPFHHYDFSLGFQQIHPYPPTTKNISPQ